MVKLCIVARALRLPWRLPRPGLPCEARPSGRFAKGLTGDARPRFFESMSFVPRSRSGGDAREAMTVGCKPTSQRQNAPEGRPTILVIAT